MATKRSAYRELPGTPLFATKSGTGDITLLSAATDFTYLLRMLTLQSVTPADTQDRWTLKINGGTSGTSIITLVHDGSNETCVQVFDPPIVCKDAVLDKDTGTANTVASLLYHKVADTL